MATKSEQFQRAVTALGNEADHRSAPGAMVRRSIAFVARAPASQLTGGIQAPESVR
ncbi:MAG: hypothetical protein ABJE47_07645 [bacterium]